MRPVLIKLVKLEPVWVKKVCFCHGGLRDQFVRKKKVFLSFVVVIQFKFSEDFPEKKSSILL